MAYKNDSHLVISNKFGGLSGDAKAMLFETYDLLRDITVSGSASDGAGFGTAGSFLWKTSIWIYVSGSNRCSNRFDGYDKCSFYLRLDRRSENNLYIPWNSNHCFGSWCCNWNYWSDSGENGQQIV